jgi:hypothetical protein
MKKILAILLVALLAISLVACAPEEENNNELDAYVPPVTTFKIETGTLSFKEGAAESAVISGYTGIATAHEIEIPEKMNDREVSGIGAQAFYYCTALTTVKLPSTVTFIDDYAFAGCTSLETIVIPASVTRIGKLAFQGCTALKSVVFLGTDVEIIDDFAFNDCTELKSIVLPEGLKTIGNQAFQDCKKLSTLTVQAVTPPTISTNSFTNCSALKTIRVPKGSLSAYKSATNWSAFASKMVESEEV